MANGNAYFDEIRNDSEVIDPDPQVEDMMDVSESVNGPSQTAPKPNLGVTRNVQELLKCTVCFNSMYPPIHRCTAGHTICCRCKTMMLNRCPTCRHELGNMDVGESVNGLSQTTLKPNLGVTGSVCELLECPVCLNSMYPPIYQCINGHIICSSCKPRVLNRCPACRHELGNIRCLALEKVAASLELPCKYQSFGCTGIYPYYSKTNHESQCVFRPYTCSFPGSEYTVIRDIPYLATHLKDDHEVAMHSGVENLTWMLTSDFETMPPKLRVKLETKRALEDVNLISKIPFCPTYKPSEKEFEDPMAYIMEKSSYASDYGICKIVPPVSALVPATKVLKQVLESKRFLAECLPLQIGYSGHLNNTTRDYNFQEFQKTADEFFEKQYEMVAQLSHSQMETDFWRRVSQKDTETIQHVEGINTSAFSSDTFDPLAESNWNLKNFARLEQSSLRFVQKKIQGVTEPIVCLGMLWSYIHWHAEPGHLYRIDYHHCGAPRTWYSTPNTETYKFEEMVDKFVFPNERLKSFEAYAILNFKRLLFSPTVMVKHEVPIFKVVQYPGEFIITFPRSYHMTFSQGFSCWESVNFATPDWFSFGDEASDRLALYARPQVVPYQELLVREVMHLHKNNNSELSDPIYRNMKVLFVCLIRMHRFAFNEMKKTTGLECSMIESGSENKTFLCGTCERECYLAYVKCDCYPKGLCIFHDIYKKCPCKDSRVMAVREEFKDMEIVADEFKNDGGDEFLKEVDVLYNIKFVAFSNTPIPVPSQDREKIDKPQLPKNSPTPDEGWSGPVPKKRRTPRN